MCGTTLLPCLSPVWRADLVQFSRTALSSPADGNTSQPEPCQSGEFCSKEQSGSAWVRGEKELIADEAQLEGRWFMGRWGRHCGRKAEETAAPWRERVKPVCCYQTGWFHLCSKWPSVWLPRVRLVGVTHLWAVATHVTRTTRVS